MNAPRDKGHRATGGPQEDQESQQQDSAPSPVDVGLTEAAFQELLTKAAPYFDIRLVTADSMPAFLCVEAGESETLPNVAAVEELIKFYSTPLPFASSQPDPIGAPKLGRGKSQKSLAMVDVAREILEEIQPATVRAVCYRLFVLKLIKSMAKSETSKVSKQLTWAREQGRIPWEWIVDETRAPERIAQWDDPESIMLAAAKQYKKDYWETQANRVEVWSEKGTVRGTLAPVLEKYRVTFRVMHGYGSATAIHDIAEETARHDKPLTVLYVGDWDPSGMNMSEIDLPARLARYGGKAKIIRIALDESDVDDDTELPWFEAQDKQGDSRYEWFVESYGRRCWELDALPPPELRARVEAKIVALLDMDAWNHVAHIEAVELESMANGVASFARVVSKSISRQVTKYSDRGDQA